MFFSMANRLGKAFLSDVNEELIMTYRAVRDDLDDLLPALKCHAEAHKENTDYYYEVRAAKPNDSVGIAARLIYLNQTCFNGLYRVNGSGEFNVIKGSGIRDPRIHCPSFLRSCSDALSMAELSTMDFQNVNPAKGDLVYCDPPYYGMYDGYTQGKFNRDDHVRLRECMDAWSNVGAKVVVSNADVEFTRELYDGWNVFGVVDTNFISGKSESSGDRKEIIVTNMPHRKQVSLF